MDAQSNCNSQHKRLLEACTLNQAAASYHRLTEFLQKALVLLLQELIHHLRHHPILPVIHHCHFCVRLKTEVWCRLFDRERLKLEKVLSFICPSIVHVYGANLPRMTGSLSKFVRGRNNGSGNSSSLNHFHCLHLSGSVTCSSPLTSDATTNSVI